MRVEAGVCRQAGNGTKTPERNFEKGLAFFKDMLYNNKVLKRAVFHIAGWSSPVARRAHNPKVGGSNPPPATMLKATF